jgi:hypothetical protein
MVLSEKTGKLQQLEKANLQLRQENDQLKFDMNLVIIQAIMGMKTSTTHKANLERFVELAEACTGKNYKIYLI